MFRNKLAIVSAALLTGAIATTAFAAPGAPGTPALQGAQGAPNGPVMKQPPLPATVMFNMLDENGDGALDAAEIEKVTAAIVASVDTDGDGKLTQEELGGIMARLGRGGPGERGPKGGDHQGQKMGRGGDHDGMGRGHGGRGGHDGDHQRFGQQQGPQGQGMPGQRPQGQKFGMGQGPQGMGQDHQGQGQRFGMGQGPQGQGLQGDRGARFAERLGIDADGLTKEEFIEHQTERFAALDTDGDGTVTLEEFSKAGQNFRGPVRVR